MTLTDGARRTLGEGMYLFPTSTLAGRLADFVVAMLIFGVLYRLTRRYQVR